MSKTCFNIANTLLTVGKVCVREENDQKLHGMHTKWFKETESYSWNCLPETEKQISLKYLLQLVSPKVNR